MELIIFDTPRDGMLDSDEFALAMHLMNIKLDGEYTTDYCLNRAVKKRLPFLHIEMNS